MHKEIGILIIGIAIEILFLILQIQVKDMPIYVAIIGYIVGGLLLIYGLICVFFPSRSIREVIMSIRFQSPITFKRKNLKPKEVFDEGKYYYFYVNRKELNRARGDLADLLSNHQKVWGIFHTGTLLTLSGIFAKCHFERLILTDPRDDYMMKIMEPRGKNVIQYREQIIQTAEIAYKRGCDVKYYSGAIGASLTIADEIKLANNKFSVKAWVQVETSIPFLSTIDRSSFLIYNKNGGIQPFNAYLEHFNTVWTRSKPIPKEDIESEKST